MKMHHFPYAVLLIGFCVFLTIMGNRLRDDNPERTLATNTFMDAFHHETGESSDPISEVRASGDGADRKTALNAKSASMPASLNDVSTRRLIASFENVLEDCRLVLVLVNAILPPAEVGLDEWLTPDQLAVIDAERHKAASLMAEASKNELAAWKELRETLGKERYQDFVVWYRATQKSKWATIGVEEPKP